MFSLQHLEHQIKILNIKDCNHKCGYPSVFHDALMYEKQIQIRTVQYFNAFQEFDNSVSNTFIKLQKLKNFSGNKSAKYSALEFVNTKNDFIDSFNLMVGNKELFNSFKNNLNYCSFISSVPNDFSDFVNSKLKINIGGTMNKYRHIISQKKFVEEAKNLKLIIKN